MSQVVTVHLIAAARPNFMKVAPLFHELSGRREFKVVLVHTGQHYDSNMSDAFFRDLRLPSPDFHLGIGSGSHAEQTGNVMIAYERVVTLSPPTCIVVVGDVNSTLACALVGAKLRIPVVHLEAGLRSGDRDMPEEINRLATDAVSDVLWTPSPDADLNLAREGVARDRIDLVGNIMIDSFEMLRGAIESDSTVERLGLKAGDYMVVTVHRPSNVDHEEALRPLVESLIMVADSIAAVIPLHPRTRRQLERFDLLTLLASNPRIVVTEPLGYVQFMNVVKSARGVITDSGGVQEETTYLGIPCITLRANTERPVTVTMGTNRLCSAEGLEAAVSAVLDGRWPRGSVPPLWDGRTAMRCAERLIARFITREG